MHPITHPLTHPLTHASTGHVGPRPTLPPESQRTQSHHPRTIFLQREVPRDGRRQRGHFGVECESTEKRESTGDCEGGYVQSNPEIIRWIGLSRLLPTYLPI